MAPSEVDLFICRPDPRILSPTSESILNNSLIEASKKSMGTFNKSPHTIADLDPSLKRTPESMSRHLDEQLYSQSSESLNTVSEAEQPSVHEADLTGEQEEEEDNSIETSSMSSTASSESEDEEVISATEQRSMAMNQHLRADFNDTRSSISANSSTTMGTQVSELNN